MTPFETMVHSVQQNPELLLLGLLALPMFLWQERIFGRTDE